MIGFRVLRKFLGDVRPMEPIEDPRRSPVEANRHLYNRSESNQPTLSAQLRAGRPQAKANFFEMEGEARKLGCIGLRIRAASFRVFARLSPRTQRALRADPDEMDQRIL